MAGQWFSNSLRRIPPLHATARRVRQAFEPYRIRLWALEGRVRNSGAVLRLAYAGQLESKNYFAHLAFDAPPAETDRGRIWMPHALRLPQPEPVHADLFVVDVAQPLYRRFGGTPGARGVRTHLLPCWVQGELPIGASRAAETLRSDARLVARNALRYRLTREPAAFDRFYHEMYLPYMNKVYPGRAFLMSPADLQAQRAHTELMLIRRGDEDIAGQLLVYRDGRAHGWSVGVKDGDPALVKAGALAALYCFVPPYLAAQGYRTVDAGLSRPFLRDGVLRYKRKWGLRLFGAPPRLFVLKAACRAPGVRAFLQDNPFIERRDDGLRGTVFLPPGGDSERARAAARRQYFIPGLDGIDFHTFDD